MSLWKCEEDLKIGEAGWRGGKGDREKHEMYVHHFSTINVFSIYHKHVLIKKKYNVFSIFLCKGSNFNKKGSKFTTAT